MKRIHLLKTELDAPAFEPLISAAKGLGLRVGWLRWAPERPPASIDESLRAAAELGALRAVAAEHGRVTATKPMVGPPVLRDVLREHFRGCVAVIVQLVDGATLPAEPAAILSIDKAGDELTLRAPDGRSFELGAARLAEELRRPRPFGDPA